jgi:protein ImuB
MLSVWFPRLASDHALRMRPYDGAFALTLRAGNSDHLHCLNKAAEVRGLRRGMALADARAICPDLATRPADLAREAAALVALRRWLSRYSPLVGSDGADGLVADISGVAHLFGDEAGLRADLHARLDRAGIEAASGIADTRGAAHALSHSRGGIAPPGKMLAAIGDLPVRYLRIDHATSEALQRLGLRRIADLVLQPRAPLARRFGASLLFRLDQALGAQPEPVAGEREPPHYGVRLTLPEPIGLQSDVMAGLERLLERLCATLARETAGARRLRLDLHRVDGHAAVLEIGLAQPMRDPARLAALFARSVDEVDAGFGIDALRLTAPVVESMAAAQITASGQKTGDDLADLITRLGNRIGFDNVQRLLPAESLVPERSFLTVAAAYVPANDSHSWSHALPRPLVMFPPEPVQAEGPEPPKRFRWRRMSFSTLRATGPERITSEWWFDDPAWRSGLRDYWKVETQQGQRLWMFHTPQNPGWCVQGEFL